MFPVNSWMHDMIHQGALIAPRPLLFGEGKKDALFPVAGYMEFYEKVGKLYAAYGKEDAFRLLEVDTGHQDSDFLREEVLKWFDRFLMETRDRKLDMSYTNAPAEKLAVFPGGKTPADARNARVHEFFTTRPPSGRFATRQAWEKRKTELMAALRDKVFGALPRNPRNARIEQAGNEFTVASDNTVPVRALWRKGRGQGRQAAVLYIASDGDDDAALNRLLGGLKVPDPAARLILFPRGTGEVPWNKTASTAMLRNAMHVGETVDSMRLADVLAAVDALIREPDVDPQRVTVAGAGMAGAIGMYAAILDSRVQHVVVIDPPESHVQGPVFLNVLRHTDLPEAAALLAPRRLSFYARMPKAYEYSRHVWALYGKSGAFAGVMRIGW
jgi:hypothetical protein